MTVQEDTIKLLVKELVRSIEELIQSNKKQGTLKPQKKIHRKWKFNNFRYTDMGVQYDGGTVVEISKDDWYTAIWMILTKIKETDIYKKLQKESTVLKFLHGFSLRICQYYVTNDSYDQRKIEEMIEKFMDEVHGKPATWIKEIDLSGIALRPKSIKIIDGITLRQVELEDLEKEFQLGDNDFESHRMYSSAIMKIELTTGNPDERNTVNSLAVTILRLFKVGSIKESRSQSYSESFVEGGVTRFYSEEKLPLEIGLIKEEDTSKLQNFWKNIESYIPLNFFKYEKTKLTFQDIAYQRYVDALLNNGSIERRITNAIMGLESIFLRDGGELQELSYRLRFRIAKLISKFNYESLKVLTIIKDAYYIRSKFVHGGTLTEEDKKKLNKENADVKALLQKLLDMLRITIVVTITMKESKDQFISILDKSFLEKSYEERLDQIIKNTRNVLLEN